MAGQNIGRWEMQTEIQGEVDRVREMPATIGETRFEETSLMVKYRIIEMG